MDILYDSRKKLDEKSHACIMMVYSEESKAYQLFDSIKLYIIIKCNVIFDEKTFVLGLLKSSFVASYSDPFGIVQDIGLTIPPMDLSTNTSTSILELIDCQGTSIETMTSPNQSCRGNGTSPTPCLPPCLPQWVVRMMKRVITLMLKTSLMVDRFVITSSKLVLF